MLGLYSYKTINSQLMNLHFLFKRSFDNCNEREKLCKFLYEQNEPVCESYMLESCNIFTEVVCRQQHATKFMQQNSHVDNSRAIFTY